MVYNSYFEKVLLMNSDRTYRNLPKSFISAHFSSHFFRLHLMLEDYEQDALRKEPVFAAFIEQFKIATLGKSYG